MYKSAGVRSARVGRCGVLCCRAGLARCRAAPVIVRAELLGTALLGLGLLGTKRLRGADELRGKRLEERGSLRLLGLHGARQLGEQHLAGLEVRELLDLVGGQRLTVKDTALDDESGILLGEVAQTLRRFDRVTGDE